MIHASSIQRIPVRATIYLSTALAVCALLLQTPVFAQGQPDEIDAYLAGYMRNVNIVKRTTNERNEQLSCVDVDRQPAMNHPSWRGAVVRDLSPQDKARFPGVIVPAPPSLICPEGTVEMRLPTRAQIVGAGGLHKFLSKHSDDGPEAAAAPQSSGANLSDHYYAVDSASLPNTSWGALAAQSTIEVWQPSYVSGQEFSLSQMWVSGGTGSALQTAEAGVQAYPAHWQGDGTVRFFIYFTANNYRGTGCYNVECPGFVQVSSVLPIGGFLAISSPGNIKSGTIAWYRDSSGNWTLLLANPDGTYSMSGYYPAALYGSAQMSRFADTIAFGGEVFAPGSGGKPKVGMGNGYNGQYQWQYAARQTNLKYMFLDGSIHAYSVHASEIRTPLYGDTYGPSGCAYGESGNTTSGVSTIWIGGRGASYTGCQ
jgi:hypothetical protein